MRNHRLPNRKCNNNPLAFAQPSLLHRTTAHEIPHHNGPPIGEPDYPGTTQNQKRDRTADR